MADKQLDVLIMDDYFQPLDFVGNKREFAIEKDEPEGIWRLLINPENGEERYSYGGFWLDEKSNYPYFVVYSCWGDPENRDWDTQSGDLVRDQSSQFSEVRADQIIKKIADLYKLLNLIGPKVVDTEKFDDKHAVLMSRKDYKTLTTLFGEKNPKKYITLGEITLKPVNPGYLS